MALLTFFVGSYTQMLIPGIVGKGSGIYTVQLNNETGELNILHTLKTVNPSYLVISEDGHFLYCNTEVDAAFNPKVQAYKINEDFSLAFLNEQPIPGGFPCHIEKFENNILVACYQTGNIIQYTLSESGKLQQYAKNYQHFGSSTNKDRQESPHAHQVTVHPNKNQVFVCDLGLDIIKAYHFKKEKFLADVQNDISVAKGGGPRHLVFNKNGKYAYAINELSSVISILKKNKNKFEEINSYSTLPSTYTNTPSASAIRIHPKEEFLYVANRTLDAITIFKINGDKLELLDYHYTKGKELREFNITPNGKWLIACHQNSHDTVVYQIKPNGKLTEKYRTRDLKTPVCVVFKIKERQALQNKKNKDTMKLGFGLYRHMLNEAHYKFAKQCGATHLVIHLVDYFGHEKNNKENANQPIGENEGWGKAGVANEIWTLEELMAIKKEINAHGLELEAIENFDPAHWHDILLDGPKKEEQIENLKQLIRNFGKVGIPIFGYNFSLAGVAARVIGEYARGGGISVGMDGGNDTPIPNGMVWNMVYDENAPEGTIPRISHEELWSRLQYFLNELIPVAEEAGVKLAAHPDDPPMPYIRNTPRLVYQPNMYQKLIDLKPSPFNSLEFCLGSIAEMTEGNVYEATDSYSKQQKIAYIHFRNIIGKVPNYKEVFIDEGDIDMIKILRILKNNNFNGVLIPDHTPQMTCDGAWYAGMAYAMGYMKAAMKIINNE